MTFDELIAQAIRETLDERCAEFHTDGKKHHFSLAYKIARRRTIISARKRKPLSIRRIRYILLAILFVLFALLGFSLWRTLGGYSFNVFKDHSKVYFNGVKLKPKIEEIYGLPEEYEILSINISKRDVYSRYVVGGEIVILNQDLTLFVDNANTEDYGVECLTINGNDGYYINMFDGTYDMVWIMDGYCFSLWGKIDKNTAIFLVESLKIRNFDDIP